MITTRFTEAFGVEHPIVQGGMQAVPSGTGACTASDGLERFGDRARRP